MEPDWFLNQCGNSQFLHLWVATPRIISCLPLAVLRYCSPLPLWSEKPCGLVLSPILWQALWCAVGQEWDVNAAYPLGPGLREGHWGKQQAVKVVLRVFPRTQCVQGLLGACLVVATVVVRAGVYTRRVLTFCSSQYLFVLVEVFIFGWILVLVFSPWRLHYQP